MYIGLFSLSRLAHPGGRASAIQNPASVAALLITTEAMIAELPKKGGAAGGGMPPGGGMGGMDF